MMIRSFLHTSNQSFNCFKPGLDRAAFQTAAKLAQRRHKSAAETGIDFIPPHATIDAAELSRDATYGIEAPNPNC